MRCTVHSSISEDLLGDRHCASYGVKEEQKFFKLPKVITILPAKMWNSSVGFSLP